MLKKKIVLTFLFALLLSVALPAGILCIIFGATADPTNVPLLVGGIVMTVAGFYGMPILWISYGNLRRQQSVLHQICEDHVQEIAALAANNGKQEKEMLETVRTLISKRYLTGYEIVSDKYVVPMQTRPLSKDDILEQNGEVTVTVGRCEGCGALLETSGNKKTYCPYCGTRFVPKQTETKKND